jgi:hypothetical protein
MTTEQILDLIKIYPIFIYNNGNYKLYFTKHFQCLSDRSLHIDTFNDSINVYDSSLTWLLTLSLKSKSGLLTSSSGSSMPVSSYHVMYDNGIDVLLDSDDWQSIKRQWTLKQIIE